MTLVKDFLARQDKLVRKCNDSLCNQSIKLKNELLILQLNTGSMNQCLIVANKTLCFGSHKRFKVRFNRLHEYECRHVSECEIKVQSVRNTIAPARVLSKDANAGLHTCRN